MLELLGVLTAVAVIAIFDFAAVRWGADSRHDGPHGGES